MRSPTHHHSLYGDIPLIQREAVGTDGKLYVWREYDPDYQPKVPTGGVPGNVAAQVLCRGHHIPRYFYVDEERACRQCGDSFIFTATEQKFWYERLKFNYHSSRFDVRIAVRQSERRRRFELRWPTFSAGSMNGPTIPLPSLNWREQPSNIAVAPEKETSNGPSVHVERRGGLLVLVRPCFGQESRSNSRAVRRRLELRSRSFSPTEATITAIERSYEKLARFWTSLPPRPNSAAAADTHRCPVVVICYSRACGGRSKVQASGAGPLLLVNRIATLRTRALLQEAEA
jgi:hypothetical protein